MPKFPAYSYEQGEELPIPMIVGSNAREQARNYDRSAMKRVIKANFGSLAPKAEEYYGLNKSELGNDDPLYGPASTQITADTRHRCGAVAEAVWRATHGRTTYEFQFDPPVPGEPATRHEAEIPFVFGNPLSKGPLSGSFGESDKKISADIQTYWTNFAKTGNPNGDGLPAWPKFDLKRRSFLEFTIHDGPVVRQELRRRICDLYIDALKETIPTQTVAEK
jgi:para-nitrobenzyl esterase